MTVRNIRSFRRCQFGVTFELPAGSNMVTIEATDFAEPGPNVTTEQYAVNVVGAEARTYSYDLNGNCTGYTSASGNVTNEWDAEDRLVAFSKGNIRSEFTYDGFGRRVMILEKTNGVVGSVKRFVWSGTRLCQERDATGANVTKRFYDEGQVIGTANYFYTRDHLGSIREVTGRLGVVRARYDYDPYGRRVKLAGDVESDFGFTGHYYHAPSGLHLALYRAYDAETGRWLSRDPIGEFGFELPTHKISGALDRKLNLYAYVGGDPVGQYDPDGLASAVALPWRYCVPRRPNPIEVAGCVGLAAGGLLVWAFPNTMTKPGELVGRLWTRQLKSETCTYHCFGERNGLPFGWVTAITVAQNHPCSEYIVLPKGGICLLISVGPLSN